MFFRQLFATKSLEMLHEEMAQDEGRLRRVLGPIGLTSLGVGAIIGAGIFVMAGRAAANEAGPGVMLSFAVAGLGCALAALCYAEFASLAPVAGSAYTYAYATLGELLAWIIGWDLILEYAMSCATVAASWSKYLNEFLLVTVGWEVPAYLCHDPFSEPGAWFNLPAALILGVVTVILVIGIRESAMSNTALVVVKVSVVLFVIAVGAGYISRANWTEIPVAERKVPEQMLIPEKADALAQSEVALEEASRTWAQLRFGTQARRVLVEMAEHPEAGLPVEAKINREERMNNLRAMTLAVFTVDRAREVRADLEAAGQLTPEAEARLETARKRHEPFLPKSDEDRERVAAVLQAARADAESEMARKWGLLGQLGLNKSLASIDDSFRTPFTPYGISGLMLGAAIVFFAFIGFDSISTHSEEAVNPQRDVPIGILASLVVCTLLYIGVAAVITGMQPYPTIDTERAVASAFRERGELEGGNALLHASAGLIATGALAGMTSVLLITFLSQARIFLAMARDRLLPPSVFGAIHEQYRTPHISTMLTGAIIVVVAAFTPILVLEEMVSIGTLFAFAVVCAAVLILRIRRPDAVRPFRTPLVYLVAPLGILVNVSMMLFLPLETWLRLVVWLGIGLLIYFAYSYRNSLLGQKLRGEVS